MSYAVRTFKYRLKPAGSQRTKLDRTLEFCRWVYNETLATRKNTWEQEKKTLSLYDTNKRLTLWKRDHPEFENADRRVVSVGPRNTSRQCSCCGTMVEKSLSVRVHACPVCGLVMDRDENASHNRLKYLPPLSCVGSSHDDVDCFV